MTTEGLAHDYHHRVSPAAKWLAHFAHAHSISFILFATRLLNSSQVCRSSGERRWDKGVAGRGCSLVWSRYRAAEVRALAPNCVSAVWNLLHGNLLAPKVLRWLPDVWQNLCTPELSHPNLRPSWRSGSGGRVGVQGGQMPLQYFFNIRTVFWQLKRRQIKHRNIF